MKILVEVADNKVNFAMEFFKNITFIKNTRSIDKNEITNPAILKSMEDYENKKVNPTPLSLKELKKFINA
jgi:hypothetical protein